MVARNNDENMKDDNTAILQHIQYFLNKIYGRI